jgi:nickel-dependent lactate racemase
MVVDKANAQHTIDLAYGRGTAPLYMNPELADWHVVKPKFAPSLRDAQAHFRAACRAPIAAPPLRELVQPNDRVVIVTSDGTRAVPNRVLIPWLLQELPVPPEQVTVLLGNGSHRANTPVEIKAMFGEDLATRLRVLNHDAYDPGRNVSVGASASGGQAALDKVYVEADKRIVVGFVEPHFFAGFSGGAKGIVPGLASIVTINYIHSAALVRHPLSTWGVVEGNPIRAEIEQMVAHCPPDFTVNVTLNSDKQITAFFLGHYIEAHRAGCVRSREEAMVAVPSTFAMVITSNSGYPLDQNLYQAVKGMSAAARIVEPGGTILVASECSDGVPDHGNFADLMRVGSTADDILANVYQQEKVIVDQWQAQVAAEIMKKADVLVFSAMNRTSIAQCKMGVVDDLQAEVEARIRALGGHPRVAVLPDGPLTIPYVQA